MADKETVAIIIPLAGAFLSATAIVVSYYIFSRTVRANSKPILIFTSRGGKWKLQNYGNGPALNILVGEGSSMNSWEYIVNCYPLSPGESIDLIWLKFAKH